MGDDIPIIREAGFEYILKDFCGKELHRADTSFVCKDASLHSEPLLLLKGNMFVHRLNLGLQVVDRGLYMQ